VEGWTSKDRDSIRRLGWGSLEEADAFSVKITEERRGVRALGWKGVEIRLGMSRKLGIARFR
jgi:hypothetical protein